MEIAKTIAKILVIVFVYFGIAPLLGFYLKGRDTARRITLGFMAWWLVRPPSDFTLMLYSVELYRGHTKGFEFNFIEAIAIGLALASWLEKRKDFRWFPPGLWAWYLWVGVSLFSIVNALNNIYTLMPAFKFIKMAFIFIGVFAAVHDERDVKAIMRGFAIALIVQIFVCIWARYGAGGFRIQGWFEHQNPMAMWSYTLALPLLGLAISKRTSPQDLFLYFCAFGAAGLAVVLSVSRASLAAFAVGSAGVMLGSLLKGITFRKIALGVLGAIGGLAVIAVAADTFMSRLGVDDTPKNDLRYALNLQSAAMLKDHPFVGIGWNNFGLANSRPQGQKYSEILERWEANRGRNIYPEQFEENPLTESLYWLLLAENGALGFSTFMLFSGIILWFATRTTIAFWKTPLGLLLLGMTVAIAINYAHGQFERILTQTKNLTTWMIFCAIFAKAEWWRRRQKADFKKLQQSRS